jgi:hypothetical protein
VYVIEGDELVTEDDPKGDTKIDKNGNLLGGAFAQFFSSSSFQLAPMCARARALSPRAQQLRRFVFMFI